MIDCIYFGYTGISLLEDIAHVNFLLPLYIAFFIYTAISVALLSVMLELCKVVKYSAILLEVVAFKCPLAPWLTSLEYNAEILQLLSLAEYNVFLAQETMIKYFSIGCLSCDIMSRTCPKVKNLIIRLCRLPALINPVVQLQRW